MTSGAILTGPQVSPLDVSTAGEYVLGFTVGAGYFQRVRVVHAASLPYVTHQRPASGPCRRPDPGWPPEAGAREGAERRETSRASRRFVVDRRD